MHEKCRARHRCHHRTDSLREACVIGARALQARQRELARDAEIDAIRIRTSTLQGVDDDEVEIIERDVDADGRGLKLSVKNTNSNPSISDAARHLTEAAQALRRLVDWTYISNI